MTSKTSSPPPHFSALPSFPCEGFGKSSSSPSSISPSSPSSRGHAVSADAACSADTGCFVAYRDDEAFGPWRLRPVTAKRESPPVAPISISFKKVAPISIMSKTVGANLMPTPLPPSLQLFNPTPLLAEVRWPDSVDDGVIELSSVVPWLPKCRSFFVL